MYIYIFTKVMMKKKQTVKKNRENEQFNVRITLFDNKVITLNKITLIYLLFVRCVYNADVTQKNVIVIIFFVY